jgi:hypothetical protein
MIGAGNQPIAEPDGSIEIDKKAIWDHFYLLKIVSMFSASMVESGMIVERSASAHSPNNLKLRLFGEWP